MAITLNEMREGMQDKVKAGVIDVFLEESDILQALPFDDAVSPSGGSTLTYGYVQEKIPAQTAFRALNTEYTPNQAQVEKKSVELKIFGGAFQIDRVLKKAEGMYNNVAFQMREKIKSAVATFHDAMINGDAPADANGFDGLDKFLVGQKTEFNTDAYIDLSTKAKLEENASVFYEKLKKLISATKADAIVVNDDMKLKIESVAAFLGYKTASEEAFGRKYTTIGDGVRIMDLGNKVSVDGESVTEEPIIAVKARTVGGSSVTGITDIFAVHFGVEDGFHGVTLTGDNGIDQYLPDFNQPGAVKTGEVEMVACVALKKTKAAGVLRNIKIA
jgi:hypothetical protein